MYNTSTIDTGCQCFKKFSKLLKGLMFFIIPCEYLLISLHCIRGNETNNHLTVFISTIVFAYYPLRFYVDNRIFFHKLVRNPCFWTQEKEININLNYNY